MEKTPKVYSDSVRFGFEGSESLVAQESRSCQVKSKVQIVSIPFGLDARLNAGTHARDGAYETQTLAVESKPACLLQASALLSSFWRRDVLFFAERSSSSSVQQGTKEAMTRANNREDDQYPLDSVLVALSSLQHLAWSQLLEDEQTNERMNEGLSHFRLATTVYMVSCNVLTNRTEF